jgi:hypothetical protein
MAAILFLPFEIRTDFFLTSSLYCFVMNKILFMTLFFIKRSRLALQKRLFCLVIEWSGFQMPGTGKKSNPKTDHGLDFGC